jgi:hypothetical protein
MDKQLFERLVESAKQAVAISNGKLEPSRTFTFELPHQDAKPQPSTSHPTKRE